MPTIPAKASMPTNGAAVLNAVRNEIGGTYASQVPVADGTVANLRKIGEIITTYEPYANAFLSNLVNRIGRVIITSRLYENPWAIFKKGLLEYGETVEELFVNLAKPHDFDPEVAETQQFKREIPDVRAAFHTMNYQKFYKTTVSNDQLRQAFLGYQGIIDLIGRIIDSLYTAANYDEFITMKYMIARMALDGYLAPLSIPAMTSDNAKTIVSTIKGISNEITFMSDKYNYAHVPTYTDKNYQFLIINSQFDAIIDVEVLASAFNIDKAEFMGHRVLVDSFSNHDTNRLNELFGNSDWYVPFTQDELTYLNNLAGVLVDVDWFMIFDNFYNMTEKYNGEGLYWNYWYHAWKTFSASPYKTAIAIATGDQSVVSVTVTPATATVAKGQTLQLTSAVVGTGFVNKNVVWTITGNVSASTTITPAGLLKIGTDETATTITVTATSVYDDTKTGTSTITVKD